MEFLVIISAVRDILAQAHFWTVLMAPCHTSHTPLFQNWVPYLSDLSGLPEQTACELASARPPGAARPQITPVNSLLSLLRHLAHTSWTLPCVVLTHTAKWGSL